MMRLPPTKFPENSTNINTCCGEKTYVTRKTIPMRMLTNPPPITAREVEISHWQCHVTERHSGDIWSGVYEDDINHMNVFEDNDNEKDVGREYQQRN